MGVRADRTPEKEGTSMAQDRRVTRTKAALTQALFELLGEKDFDKISITELARRADVDRKTFYLHYHSAAAILEEFYETTIQRLQEGLEKDDVLDNMDLAGFFRVLNDVIGENLPLFRRLVQGQAYTYFIEQIRKILLHEADRFLLANGTTDPTQRRLKEEFLAAGIMRVYLVWLRGELNLSGEEFTDLIAHMTCQYA